MKLSIMPTVSKAFAKNILQFLREIPEEDKFIISTFSGEAVFLLVMDLLGISDTIVLGTFIGSMITLVYAYRIWLQNRQKQRDTQQNSMQEH